MLSQTKMQLWYPKKSSEDAPDEYKPQERSPSAPLSDTSEINVEYLTEDDSTCSRPATPGASDEDEVEKKRKKVCEEVSDFIDLDYWKRETLCCGTIFRGMYDEIIVDARFVRPCKNYYAKRKAGLRLAKSGDGNSS